MVLSRSGCSYAASSLLFVLHGGLLAQVEREPGKPTAPTPKAILHIGTTNAHAALQKSHPAAAAAVEQGLRWLAAHQDKDGRWNADEFMDHDAKERTDGPGRPTYDTALTGLAVFALARQGVAAGTDPHYQTIVRGAHWLALQQHENGRLGGNQTHDFIYGHAMGTLGLWAATAATGSTEAREAADKAITYLEAHRNPYSVWRYQPRDNDNDSSVTTWAVLSYLAALEQGAKVNRAALQIAAVWFDQVTDKTGRAGYSRMGEPSSRRAGDHAQRFPPSHGEAMTAAGLLCRMGLGQTTESKPITKAAADLLLAKPPQWDPANAQVDHCYWFFASEALRHFGGEHQREWATKLEEALVKGQRVDGPFAGSWDPIDPWGQDGGRIYATALSVMSLQSLQPLDAAAPAEAKPK